MNFEELIPMLLSIKHSLHYQYTQEVSLRPHTLYLYPRLTPMLELLSYQLEVVPKPQMTVQSLDNEGNIQTRIYFDIPTAELSIQVNTQIKTTNYNPFGFYYNPFEIATLPFAYNDAKAETLAVYLRKQNVTTLIDQVARSVAASAGWNTSQFLVGLNEYIFKNFAYEVREEGMPFEPEKTLLEQRGSCRDFAVFFVACCQTLGLAARFVSGYQYLSPDKLIDPTQPQDLHAWAEVYLPGGGWRGFDPTQNASVTDSYIPLAASAFPQNVSPITGTFAGNAGFSFNAGVQITQNV